MPNCVSNIMLLKLFRISYRVPYDIYPVDKGQDFQNKRQNKETCRNGGYAEADTPQFAGRKSFVPETLLWSVGEKFFA